MSDPFNPKRYHFCGIGGSGMLPLAQIIKGQGDHVTGSDRSYDQGRTPEKFEYLQQNDVRLYPQDGSFIQDHADYLVVSTAVEESIPDVKAAKQGHIPIIKRSALLAERFNDANVKIAIGGTSGKTTVTGMIGFILHDMGAQPTVMNGGIFKNFQKQNPYCSALTGAGDIFVTEADESDGSIESYHPDIAVLNNIALDHKSLDELTSLFSNFIGKAKTTILNADHAGVMALSNQARHGITFGIERDADFKAGAIKPYPNKTEFILSHAGEDYPVTLNLPGQHNVSNALAAIATCTAAGYALPDIIPALEQFQGIWRRLDLVGTKNDITVIDDFAHNPDKIAASLKTLKLFPGRLQLFFQPHGYGFLKLTHAALYETFKAYLSRDDILYMVQPFYAGGTVDRSIDSNHVLNPLIDQNYNAHLMESRDQIKMAMLKNRQAGDRIIIMGARDDTLARFAEDIFDAL